MELVELPSALGQDSVEVVGGGVEGTGCELGAATAGSAAGTTAGEKRGTAEDEACCGRCTK